jgi:hypothetical protein
VDFEEMAAEQNRCPETQRLLGGTNIEGSISSPPFQGTGPRKLMYSKSLHTKLGHV